MATRFHVGVGGFSFLPSLSQKLTASTSNMESCYFSPGKSLGGELIKVLVRLYG